MRIAAAIGRRFMQTMGLFHEANTWLLNGLEVQDGAPIPGMLHARALNTLGWLAVNSRDWLIQAAILFGAGEVHSERQYYTVQELEAWLLDQLKNHLDSEALDMAIAQGKALDHDEAIEPALSINLVDEKDETRDKLDELAGSDEDQQARFSPAGRRGNLE